MAGCSVVPTDLKSQFLLILAPPFGQNRFLSSLSVSSEERQLTNISTVGIIAKRQHCAHCFGVSLLHQQLNDGLAIGLNQVLTLTTQSGGQICAHLLNCFNHLLLKQCVKRKCISGLASFCGFLWPNWIYPTSVAWSSNMVSNCFITNSQTAHRLGLRTRTKDWNILKTDFRCICYGKSTKEGQFSGVNHVIPEKICLLQIPPWWQGKAWQQVQNWQQGIAWQQVQNWQQGPTWKQERSWQAAVSTWEWTSS